MTTTDSDRIRQRGRARLVRPSADPQWLRSHPERQWLEVDGTLAFVDISGFTAMSEQLSSQGSAGAEEVTDVMNATFAALLDVAYASRRRPAQVRRRRASAPLRGRPARRARGAGGVRDAADACGRSGARARRREPSRCGCTPAPQRAVPVLPRRRLAPGAARHRAGGDAERSRWRPRPKPARSSSAWRPPRQLDPSTLGDEKGGGRLLQAAPEARGSLEPLPDSMGSRLEIAVPAPLRAQLLEVGPFEGEHRHAAIAFVRFGASTRSSRRRGADAAAEAVEELVAGDAAAAERARRDVSSRATSTATAGGSSSSPAHRRRSATTRSACSAPFAAIVDAGLPFPVHIGVSRRAASSPARSGRRFRRTYTILGDTAALAARLMARRGEDEVWVAAEAFARGGARFASTELEPLPLKGKSEPVAGGRARRALAAKRERAAGAARRAPVRRPRARARGARRRRRSPCAWASARCVELIGEPGIGKSRLARGAPRQLRRHAADHPALRAVRVVDAVSPVPAVPPLAPRRPAQRRRASTTAPRSRSGSTTIDGELVPWAPLLGGAARRGGRRRRRRWTSSTRRSGARACTGSSARCSASCSTRRRCSSSRTSTGWTTRRPSSCATSARSSRRKPWLACTTRRPVEGGFAAAEGTPPLPALTLRLEPLPAEDAKTLVRAAAGDRRLSDEELARDHRARRRQPALPAGARLAGRGRRRGASRCPTPSRRSSRRGSTGSRPAIARSCAGRPCSAASFSGALIADVLEGDPTRGVRLGGVGPARRVRRARPGRRRARSASGTR